jgi:hypothetical protein
MLVGELAPCVKYNLNVKIIGTICSAKSKGADGPGEVEVLRRLNARRESGLIA